MTLGKFLELFYITPLRLLELIFFLSLILIMYLGIKFVINQLKKYDYVFGSLAFVICVCCYVLAEIQLNLSYLIYLFLFLDLNVLSQFITVSDTKFLHFRKEIKKLHLQGFIIWFFILFIIFNLGAIFLVISNLNLESFGPNLDFDSLIEYRFDFENFLALIEYRFIFLVLALISSYFLEAIFIKKVRFFYIIGGLGLLITCSSTIIFFLLFLTGTIIFISLGRMLGECFNSDSERFKRIFPTAKFDLIARVSNQEANMELFANRWKIIPLDKTNVILYKYQKIDDDIFILTDEKFETLLPQNFSVVWVEHEHLLKFNRLLSIFSLMLKLVLGFIFILLFYKYMFINNAFFVRDIPFVYDLRVRTFFSWIFGFLLLFPISFPSSEFSKRVLKKYSYCVPFGVLFLGQNIFYKISKNHKGSIFFILISIIIYMSLVFLFLGLLFSYDNLIRRHIKV